MQKKWKINHINSQISNFLKIVNMKLSSAYGIGGFWTNWFLAWFWKKHNWLHLLAQNMIGVPYSFDFFLMTQRLWLRAPSKYLERVQKNYSKFCRNIQKKTFQLKSQRKMVVQSSEYLTTFDAIFWGIVDVQSQCWSISTYTCDFIGSFYRNFMTRATLSSKNEKLIT